MKSYKRRRAKKAAVIQQGEMLSIESIELRLLFFCSNFYLILIILDLSDLLIINRINEQKKTSFIRKFKENSYQKKRITFRIKKKKKNEGYFRK
jgi:hypothetical protein